MTIDPKKVFPQSSRTDAQRAASEAGAATTSREGKITAKQFLDINKSIFSINRNLNAIANLLKQQADNGKASDQEDAKQQRAAADKEKKSGIESFIEGALVNTVVKPIEKARQVTGSVFEKLFKALGAIFGGYVGMKGLKGIQAWIEGDKSILNQLGNDIKAVLATAAGVFLAINVGIPLITASISALIGSLGAGGAFAGILGALGNPYVWLGIIGAVTVAAMGTTLFLLLREIHKGTFGENFEGIGSYNQMTQDAITRVSEVGVDQFKKEQRQKIEAHLAKYPWLLDKNGEIRNDFDPKRAFTHEGSILNELLQDLRYANAGDWDKWDAGQMSDENTQLFNQIPPLIEQFQGEWAKFHALAKEITLLMEDNATVEECPPQIQKKIKELMEIQQGHKDKMIGYMDGVKELREKMDKDGKNYLDMFLRRHNMPNLLYRTDWWGKVVQPGPILDAVAVQEGNQEGTRSLAINTFSNLGAMNEDLKEDIGRMPEQVSTNNTLSSSFLNTDIDWSGSATAFTDTNFATADLLTSGAFVNEGNFSFIPMSFDSNNNGKIDEDESAAYFEAMSDLPSFSIIDGANYYRDLGEVNYGGN